MNMVNQLYDAVYYGSDLEFKYNDVYYFINSGMKSVNGADTHIINVSESTFSFYEGEPIGSSHEIYSSANINPTVNTNKFFNEKIFDGQSLYEIINDIKEVNY